MTGSGDVWSFYVVIWSGLPFVQLELSDVTSGAVREGRVADLVPPDVAGVYRMLVDERLGLGVGRLVPFLDPGAFDASLAAAADLQRRKQPGAQQGVGLGGGDVQFGGDPLDGPPIFSVLMVSASHETAETPTSTTPGQKGMTERSFGVLDPTLVNGPRPFVAARRGSGPPHSQR